MSTSHSFTLVGDSNVKRNMSPMNCRDRPMMSGAQVIQCGPMPMLATALSSIRIESTICIVYCVTNFVTSSAGSDSAGLRSEPIFIEFLEKLTVACEARPDLEFFVGPPMYRTNPIWYRDGLPEILKKFSDVMRVRPSNCNLLPSFPTPTFESDGVHLSAYSGFEFVLHLFDSVGSILEKRSLDPVSRDHVTSESTRVLEDRVMVLEQDHRRLNQRFESKSAVDSELSDWQENIRNEHFFMIQGLKRLPKLEPKEWQERAKRDVMAVLTIFMGRECQVSYVKNSTGKGKDAKTLYKVAAPSVELSKEIRETFGGFFLKGKNTLPPSLKGISIRNCVTTATLARIAILQLYGKRYQDSNPGSGSKVLGYDPRPVLKIFPAQNATDKRIQTFTFIEAVTQLPSNFSASEVDELLKRFSPKLHGSLKSLFIVVSDDMLRKHHKPSPSTSKQNSSDRKGSSQRSKGTGTGTSSGSGTSSKGTGNGTSSGSGTGSKTPETRNHKRGASGSPEDSGPSAKK